MVLAGITSRSSVAQTAAYASGENDPGAQLAKKSLEMMRQGEEEPSLAAKRKYYEEGLKLAEQSIALNDASADAHFARFTNLGRLMLLDGTVPNPINILTVNRELNRVLDLDPTYADAWAAKGGMYRQLPGLLGGSEAKAEQCLKRAIDLDEHAVGARVELAILYRDHGEPHRGVPLIEQAIVIAGQDHKPQACAEAKALLEQFRATPK